MKKLLLIPGQFLSGLIVLIFGLNAALGETVEPDEQVLNASDLVSVNLLEGPFHKVEEEVINVGFMNNFRISTDFGDFEADSNRMLRVRIKEVHAIAELQEFSKTKAFAEALAKSATKPVRAIESVVTEPVKTVKMVPQGLNRLMRRSVRIVSDAYEDTSEYVQKVSDDDEENADGSDTTEDIVDKSMDAGENFAKDKLGHKASVRELARKLEVDPYSTNTVLQKEMGKVAWAMAAGSMAMGSIMSIPDEIDSLGDLNELVWKADPLDLRLRNEKLLKELGASEELIKAFYENPHYTTSMKTGLVSAVVLLDGVKGKTILLEEAADVESSQEAWIFVQFASTLAKYHRNRQGISSIVRTSVLPLAVSNDGSIIAIVPADYIPWTRRANEVTTQMTNMLQEMYPDSVLEIWIEGEVSEHSREMLGLLGWTIFDKSSSRL
jgi:hypothetical protein